MNIGLSKRLAAVFDKFLNVLAIAAGVLLAFAVLGVGADVVLRYFLNKPMFWVKEISEYILLYVTFLVAAWVLRGDGHVKMDLVLNRLDFRTGHLITAITSAIGALVSLALAWYGGSVTWGLFQTKYFTTTALAPPMFIFIAVIAFGSFLLFIQFTRRVLSSLHRWRTPSS